MATIAGFYTTLTTDGLHAAPSPAHAARRLKKFPYAGPKKFPSRRACVVPLSPPGERGYGGPGSDVVLSERLTYLFRAPRRWELVAFRGPWGSSVMKRVVGLPGETVALEPGGAFRIDGDEAARPASLLGIRYLPYGRLAAGHEARAGAGYFVLGDHSRDSQDSRWEDSVAPEAITARPWLIVWPPGRIGWVNP